VTARRQHGKAFDKRDQGQGGSALQLAQELAADAAAALEATSV